MALAEEEEAVEAVEEEAVEVSEGRGAEPGALEGAPPDLRGALLASSPRGTAEGGPPSELPVVIMYSYC